MEIDSRNRFVPIFELFWSNFDFNCSENRSLPVDADIIKVILTQVSINKTTGTEFSLKTNLLKLK